MNYLPMAAKAGATIFTQTKVEWLEKLSAGGWRIHGKHVNDDMSGHSFTLDAREVILSAGALNSTEILLRSEMHGSASRPRWGQNSAGMEISSAWHTTAASDRRVRLRARRFAEGR